MKSHFFRNVFLGTAVILLMSCATTARTVPGPAESPPPGEGTMYDDSTRALIARRISIYDAYNSRLPGLVADLRNCHPLVGGADGEESWSRIVAGYGDAIAAADTSDIDRLTVRSEQYWKSLLVLTANDNTALFVRLVLLMREGFLARARVVLLFSCYDYVPEWERDKLMVTAVQGDINRIGSECADVINAGIALWDKGEREEAVVLYHEALEVYPKNPWALWEIGLEYRTYGKRGESVPQGMIDASFALIRAIDPMYTIAYSGTMTPELRKAGLALTDRVWPSYTKIAKGEDVNASMKAIGDGFYDMKEYEFAFYAYKYLLFHTYQGGFDAEVVEKVRLCLEALGMGDLGDYLDQRMASLEQTLKAQGR